MFQKRNAPHCQCWCGLSGIEVAIRPAHRGDQSRRIMLCMGVGDRLTAGLQALRPAIQVGIPGPPGLPWNHGAESLSNQVVPVCFQLFVHSVPHLLSPHMRESFEGFLHAVEGLDEGFSRTGEVEPHESRAHGAESAPVVETHLGLPGEIRQHSGYGRLPANRATP